MTAPSGRLLPPVSGSPPALSLVSIGSAKTSATVAAPSLGSLQYLRDSITHRDAEFSEFDDIFIQREKLVTSLQARLDELREQLEGIVAERTQLRTASATLTSELDGARHDNAILQARVIDFEAQAQVLRALTVELTDALCERDRYKVSLQFVTSQVQDLQAGYANIVSSLRASH